MNWIYLIESTSPLISTIIIRRETNEKQAHRFGECQQWNGEWDLTRKKEHATIPNIKIVGSKDDLKNSNGKNIKICNIV